MESIKVIGPVKIEGLVKDEKEIILISDVHEDYKQGACEKKLNYSKNYLTHEFLEKLFSKNKKIKWDFYLEQGANKEGIYSTLSEKDNLNFYNHCLNNTDNNCNNLFFTLSYFNNMGCFSKSKCPIKNTRFHLIDVRQKRFNENCKFSWEGSLWGEEINKIVSDHYINELEIKETKGKIEYFLDQYMQNCETCLSCMDDKKILKQIKKSTIRNNLEFYIENITNVYKEVIFFLLKNITKKKKKIVTYYLELCKQKNKLSAEKKIISTRKKFITETFGKKYLELKKLLICNNVAENWGWDLGDPYLVETCVFLCQSFIMDMYFLGRSTRKFDNKEQDHVVVLAGSSHIKFYRKVFLSEGYEVSFSSYQDNKRCAVIPDFIN